MLFNHSVRRFGNKCIEKSSNFNRSIKRRGYSSMYLVFWNELIILKKIIDNMKPLLYQTNFSYPNQIKNKFKIYRQIRYYSMDVNLVVSDTEESVRKSCNPFD